MLDTVTRYLSHLGSSSDARNLGHILRGVARRVSCQMLNSAGLVIKAGASALVKTGASASHAMVQGVLRSIAASTDMAALAGTVTNAKFNVFVYYIDASGTLTSQMGTEGATLAAVVFPATPPAVTVVGFSIINPTGAGNFVGGTTAFDDGTVVPTAVHVSVVGGFDPSIKA